MRRSATATSMAVLLLSGLLVANRTAAAQDDLRSVALEGSADRARAVQFAEPAGTITAIGADGIVRTWRLSDGKEQSKVALPTTWGGPVTLVNEGRTALGATATSALELLLLVPDAKPRQVVPADEGDVIPVVAMRPSAKGDLVVVKQRGEWNETREPPAEQSRLLRVQSGGRVNVLRPTNGPLVWAFSSGAARWIVHATFDNELVVAPRSGDEPTRTVQRAMHNMVDVRAVAVSTDGRYAAQIAQRAPTFVYDTQSGQRVMVLDDWLGTDGVAPNMMLGGTLVFIPRKRVLVVGDTGRPVVRLWDVTTGKIIRELRIAGEAISRIDVSPSGKYLAATGADGITVWELNSRELPLLPRATATPPTLPEGALRRIGASPWRYNDEITALSVSPDGKTLVAGLGSTDVIARDAATGAPKWSTRLARGSVTQMLHTPDGKTIVCARSNGRVAVLNAEDGALQDEIPHGKELGGMFQHAHCIALSSDGLLVAMGGAAGTAIWDLGRGEGRAFMPGWKADLGLGVETPVWPVGVCFTPDDKAVWSYCHDGRALRLDLESGKTVRVVDKRHTLDVIAVTRDGDHVAYGCRDRVVFVAETEPGAPTTPLGENFGRGRQPSELFLPGSRRDALALRPGGRTAWWTDAEGVLARGRVGAKPETLSDVHAGAVAAITFSADGAVAFTGGVDRTVCRWDVESAEPGERPSGHAGPITAIRYAPDGESFASGGMHDGIMVWSGATGRLLRRLDCGDEPVVKMAYSPNGAVLAAVMSVGDPTGLPTGIRVRAWQTKSGKELISRELDARFVSDIAADDAGRFVALAAWKSGLLVVTPKRKARRVNLGEDPPRPGSAVLTPDGKSLLVVARTTVLVVDTTKWSVTRTLAHPATWEAAEYWSTARAAASSDQIVAMDRSGRVAVWKPDSEKARYVGLRASSLAPGGDCQISADASTTAMLSRHGLIVVRRVKDDHHVLSLVAARTATDRDSFGLAPDGSALVTGEADGTLIIWRLLD